MVEKAELKRTITLPLITLYGLGTIVGAGIYVLIGRVSAQAGVYAPLSFLVATLVAGVTGFTYAELVSRYPRSAGEAAYAQAAFHSRWLSAMAGWAVVVVGIISSATITLGFVGYARVFIDLPDAVFVIALIVVLFAVAAWGIAESVWLAAIITVIEVLGLILVLWLARNVWADFPARADALLPPARLDAWQGVALGAFLAFYAFIGFEDMVNVAEEVKEPRRNVPLGIILALVLSAALYVAIAITAVLALPVEALKGSEAPLADIVSQSGGSPVVIAAISVVAVVNGALIQIIMASRVLYGMATQGLGPALFGNVNGYTRTPVIATLAVAGAVLVFALWLPIVTLARATSYVTLCLFIMMNVALIRIKVQAPSGKTEVSYPLWVPFVGALLCALLLAAQSFWA